MAISRTDHQDLVLTLLGGLFEPAPWDLFLQWLLARTRAERVHLIVRAGDGGADPVMLRAGNRQDGGNRQDFVPSEVAERRALAELGLTRLRAGRVYALEELRALDDPARRARQDEELAAARIGDARTVRITAPGGYDVWLALLNQRPEFGAPDSALLTSLIPAVEVAVASLAAVAGLRVRAAAAEGALARLGVGQALLDRHGQVLTADEVWLRHMPAAACAPLVQPGAEMAGAGTGAGAGAGGAGADTARQVVVLDDGASAVLLRPGLPGGTVLPDRVGAVAAIRTGQERDTGSAARVLAQELGLSAREASLAVLLSRGHGLVEAGRMLRLTPETARNYSKRIYAKTGAAGQADLVRMVLGSLAALA